MIKVSGFTDNAVGLSHTTGTACPDARASTSRWCRCCGSSSSRPDTPLKDDVKRTVAGQRDKAGGRLAAICGVLGDSRRAKSSQSLLVSVSRVDDTRPAWEWPRCELHDRPSSDSPDDGRDAPGGRDRSQESGDWVERDATARTAYVLEYRQHVEAAYGQYSADQGLALPGNPEREADAGPRERCLG
jgi:hypothetical protein